MAKLRSRAEYPPGGFQFVEPRIPAWRAPSNASFNRVVQAVIDLRLGNRWLITEHHKSVDFQEVEREVDEFNAARMLAAGHDHFVVDGVGTSFRSSTSFLRPQRLQRVVAAAAENLKKATIGVKVVLAWLGEDCRPVEKLKSESRASVCVDCPSNDPEPSYISRMGDFLRERLEAAKEMELSTSVDDNLHRCNICDCPLKTKVHVPLKHIKQETDATIYKQLEAVRTKTGLPCWIVSELKTDELYQAKPAANPAPQS